MADGTSGVKTEAAVAVAVPAIGISVACNVADNYQATLQFFVPGDAPAADLNAAMDKLLAAADRQTARYAIPKLIAEKRKLQGDIDRSQFDMANVEAAEGAKRAALEVQFKTIHEDHGKAVDKAKGELNLALLDLNKTRKEEFDAGYDEWSKRGMRGAYEAKGARKASLDRIDFAIRKATDELAALHEGLPEYNAQAQATFARIEEHDAEAGVAAKSLQEFVDHVGKRIAQIDEEIAEKKVLLGG